MPHFLCDNSKKELWFKMWHHLATWRLFLCKAGFHPLINMLYCNTLSEILVQLWRYVLKTMHVIVFHMEFKKLIGVFIIKVFLCITQCSDCTCKEAKFKKSTENTRHRGNKTDVIHRSDNPCYPRFLEQEKWVSLKLTCSTVLRKEI